MISVTIGSARQLGSGTHHGVKRSYCEHMMTPYDYTSMLHNAYRKVKEHYCCEEAYEIHQGMVAAYYKPLRPEFWSTPIELYLSIEDEGYEHGIYMNSDTSRPTLKNIISKISDGAPGNYQPYLLQDGIAGMAFPMPEMAYQNLLQQVQMANYSIHTGGKWHLDGECAGLYRREMDDCVDFVASLVPVDGFASHLKPSFYIVGVQPSKRIQLQTMVDAASIHELITNSANITKRNILIDDELLTDPHILIIKRGLISWIEREGETPDDVDERREAISG